MKFFLSITIALTSYVSANVYQYDPCDFATEVIAYNSIYGVDGYGDPNTALGRPTVDTSYTFPANPIGPVIAVSGAGQETELFSMGYGGYLILKFGRQVTNNVNNPYGIDFIIYGNAFQQLSGEEFWQNGNPNLTTIGTNFINAEPGTVSVAQYPEGPWYSFSDPCDPVADDFAPTLGRIYDTEDPNTALGEWNLWWSNPTDPTKPLDPAMTADDLKNKTVAQAAQLYGICAGGTGFDLDDVGLDWIQYVKIASQIDVTTEIDAVADVDEGQCGDQWHPYPIGDLTENCVVDIEDFAQLAAYWLTSNPAGDVDNSGFVDLTDFQKMVQNWGDFSWVW